MITNTEAGTISFKSIYLVLKPTILTLPHILCPLKFMKRAPIKIASRSIAPDSSVSRTGLGAYPRRTKITNNYSKSIPEKNLFCGSDKLRFNFSLGHVQGRDGGVLFRSRNNRDYNVRFDVNANSILSNACESLTMLFSGRSDVRLFFLETFCFIVVVIIVV